MPKGGGSLLLLSALVEEGYNVPPAGSPGVMMGVMVGLGLGVSLDGGVLDV